MSKNVHSIDHYSQMDKTSWKFCTSQWACRKIELIYIYIYIITSINICVQDNVYRATQSKGSISLTQNLLFPSESVGGACLSNSTRSNRIVTICPGSSDPFYIGSY